MVFAKRTANLKPEGAYQVLARAQELEVQGHDIIHLEIGQPDFDTPANISMVGIRAIAEGHTRYNSTAGMPELQAVIAADAGRRSGIDIRPEQVLVSPGAKPNLFFPTLALVQQGDEVMVPNPGFPTYEAMIDVAGGIPVPVPLLEENEFSFDLEAFDRLINERTRLIVLNSPSNPTGGVLPLADLEHIADAAQRYDCWVLSDEIYTRLVYDGEEAPSIAALPGMANRTVIMDGFSKTYAMTGWRLGYGIMPEPLARRVQLLFTHALGSTAHFTQIAGVEALTGTQESVVDMLAEYQRRRDIIVAGLNGLPGVQCRKPQGAFYAFPNVKSLDKRVDDLANLLLEEAGVAVLPGTAFGKYGEGYLRLSYANSVENINKALERIENVLRRF